MGELHEMENTQGNNILMEELMSFLFAWNDSESSLLQMRMIDLYYLFVTPFLAQRIATI